jgi:hypothetical protein
MDVTPTSAVPFPASTVSSPPAAGNTSVQLARRGRGGRTSGSRCARLQIILDWHHLDKKCQEQLSHALNNRHARNDVLEELLRLLWYGNLDGAIAYLRQVDHKYAKSADDIEKLIGYFERNRQHIPCYAVRKKLGLRNSSNRGEKANDLVVSFRQKHNGMSWSQQGSFALSTLDTLVRNDTVVRAAHRRLQVGRVAIDRTASVLSSRRQGQGRAAPALRACRAPHANSYAGSRCAVIARSPGQTEFLGCATDLFRADGSFVYPATWSTSRAPSDLQEARCFARLG